MISLPELETLPEVALARDLLRSWYGLELAVVGVEHFTEGLRGTEPCRTVAGSQPAACAASWAELKTAILGSKAAAVHRCHAGVLSVAAPIPGHEPPRGAVIASGGRSAESTAQIAALLGAEAGEVQAMAPTAELDAEQLRHACDLVNAAAAALARAAEAAEP
jgi:hypothetical protein